MPTLLAQTANSLSIGWLLLVVFALCVLAVIAAIMIAGGVYRHKLVGRYLRRKLAPLFAALAVTLCTAMVLIVISVMGGFLNNMRVAAQTLSGHLTVASDLAGFPHYQEFIDRIEAMPEFEAAAPKIRAYGLINIAGRIKTVEVFGIDPASVDQVTNFSETIYWTDQRLDVEMAERLKEYPDMAEMIEDERRAWEMLNVEEAGKTLTVPGAFQSGDGVELTAIVPGIHVNPNAHRRDDGTYRSNTSALANTVTLTVMPITQRGGLLEPAVRDMMVVNEFKSNLFMIDSNRVYVPIDVLQKMLLMDPAQAIDEETGMPTGEMTPARVSEVLIRKADGVPLEEARELAEQTMLAFLEDHRDVAWLSISTWEEQNQILAAVEKEKGLLTILFAIISLVAIVMIGVIFYMIVQEKTRDIGILRAMGAARSGIAGVFVTYGLSVGIIGAILGLTLGSIIVWRLNEIQDLLHAWFGFKMWDPAIYYFDKIPNQVDPFEAAWIGLIAVLSSVIGSIVPAFLAARLDPVESLRYE